MKEFESTGTICFFSQEAVDSIFRKAALAQVLNELN
jgi:hypothetical protein